MKAHGIEADLSARVIALVSGKLKSGKPFWCYVAVKPTRYEAFAQAGQAKKLDLTEFEDYGEIVVSDVGEKPSQQVTDRVAQIYKMNPEDFFKPVNIGEAVDRRVLQMKKVGEF